MKKIFRLLILIISFFCTSFVEKSENIKNSFIEKKDGEDFWIEKTFNGLSLKQKLGQLFMVASYATQDYRDNISSIEDLVNNYEVGGIIFMKGKVNRQIELTNYYQKISKIPLMIAIDAEWGLEMRLDNTFRFPWNLTLGAIQNDEIIKNVGETIGRQCKEIGVNINFSPDVDLNTNYKNPIIGNRSFGENKQNTFSKGLAMAVGIESQNVMSVIKHFPGHGDTEQDSHKSLPIINKTKEEIYKEELFPFKNLIKKGVNGVMVGHLEVPSLDSKYPSSISDKIITGILKEKFKFQGLIFTDALNMHAVSKNYKVGELELLALLAGNDILVYPEFPKKSLDYLILKFENSEINENLINEKVKKILKYKYRLGLNNKPKEIDTAGIIKKLNNINDSVISQTCYENSITLLKNKDRVLPIKYLDFQKIGVLSLGEDFGVFHHYLEKYTNINYIDYNKDSFMQEIEKMTTVIISIHKSDKNPWESFVMTDKEKEIVEMIVKKKKTILCFFGSPYGLLDFEYEDLTKVTLVAYQNNYFSQKVMPQMLFGALGIKGKIPITSKYKINSGITLAPLDVISYGYPEQVGMDSKKLLEIDSIMNKIIENKYIPGGQVLVIKDRKVIYSNSFGFQSYAKIYAIKDNTIYDLASITKIISTTLMIMYLEEKNMLDLDEKIGDILPKLKYTDKKDITIKEILAHNSGLISWFPFYKRILDKAGNIDPKWVSDHKKTGYEIETAHNIYLKNELEDSLRYWIYNSKMKDKKLSYSDIGFFILGDVIKEKLKTQNFENILYDKFYFPLGAYRLTYKPLEKFNINEIAPTEHDDYFRKNIIEGYTHDIIACMEKSTTTNSGLFSNANDLAKIGQMLLQKGEYGGIKYLKPSTISKYNKIYYKNNRRGLGFDKPEFNSKKERPNTLPISEESFGHTGFTGTMIWIDPKTQLVYIFLSNRTFPSIKNDKLSKNNIRTDIQKIIYNSFSK